MAVPVAPNAQVMIVGAGPTGLTLAVSLARYGVRVRIIEKKAHLSRHTKATNLMQRNQEVLAALGLLEPLSAIGGAMRRMMVHGYGRSFGPRTMHLNETAFPDVLLCGQHNFEAVMAAALARMGVQIEFGTALTDLTQTENGATAIIEAIGGVETVRCDYVIGCDGAAGITRTFTRHDFTPTKTGVAIRQADCTLTWHRLSTMEQLWLFYFPHGFATVVPLPGGVHRVLIIEPKTNMPAREPTLMELQSKLRAVTQDESLTLTDPQWFSYTDLSMGIASGLRDGRIILAGDVGNPILPNGGQGMNTGISDAFNLGWKLASVLNEGAPDVLLDTYAQERLALRSSLQNAQYNSLKYTTLVTPKWMQALVRRLGEPLLNQGGEYRIAQAFSELAINTRRSPLTLETMGRRGLRAGDRVRGAEVVRGTETVALADLLYAGGWTLLAFAGTRNAGSHAVTDAVRALDRGDLACAIIATDGRIVATEASTILYDLDEVVHRIYGVTKPTLYLVRPDGYVGARVSLRNVAQLREYAARWVPRNTCALAADFIQSETNAFVPFLTR